MNIFYQLIGFGALIAMGLSYWQNDKRTILLWQVVANLIFAIHYTLLHARSGAEQVLHFGRILFAELHDGIPGMHTAVIDQDRKVLCGSIEAGSKIGMIVSEPLPLEGL